MLLKVLVPGVNLSWPGVIRSEVKERLASGLPFCPPLKKKAHLKVGLKGSPVEAETRSGRLLRSDLAAFEFASNR